MADEPELDFLEFDGELPQFPDGDVRGGQAPVDEDALPEAAIDIPMPPAPPGPSPKPPTAS